MEGTMSLRIGRKYLAALIALSAFALFAASEAHAQKFLGRVGVRNTPFDPGTWRQSGSLRESESQLGGPSGLVPSRTRRPTFESNARQQGYRRYNNVRVQNNGNVTMDGRIVGQARVKVNPQNGNKAWVYRTQRGGTVFRRQHDSSRQTYVRPGYRK
jgi:hypothetical protein